MKREKITKVKRLSTWNCAKVHERLWEGTTIDTE